MRMSTLLFANRSLEDRFRKTVDTNVEVGGYLFANTWRRDVVSFPDMDAYNDTYPQVIHSWLIIPNLSKKPQNSWSITTDLLDSYKKSARLTAKSLQMQEIFWHSHPTGTSRPSVSDVEFTLRHCQITDNIGEQAIVSLNPLRVYLYAIKREKKHITIDEGDFLSWRSKALREMAGSN